MNILKFLDAFAPTDKTSEDYGKFADRRESLQKLSGFSKNLALAAIPAAVLALVPKKSNAAVAGLTATNDAVIDVLNFALTLEFLEREYYTMGVSSGVIPASDLPIFQQIKKHEVAHVIFLTDTINALGGTPVALTSAAFDFTADGAFDPSGNYAQFLALSQAFEDTGVRAYKGQAGVLLGTDAVLTAALQIHSVEARHASEVRRLRKRLGMDDDAKGWITGASRGSLPAAAQPVYDGEDNLVHGGVDATTTTTVSAAYIMEAFDEPLTDTETLAIASLFLA